MWTWEERPIPQLHAQPKELTCACACGYGLTAWRLALAATIFWLARRAGASGRRDDSRCEEALNAAEPPVAPGTSCLRIPGRR
jgi:hypothetical protein